MSLPGEAAPEEALCRPPREAWPLARVLNALLMKMGRTGLLAQPRCGPQADKSGGPRYQNADSSPRAQGALELGFEAKPKVNHEAPRAPKACSLGRCVAVDWMWVSPLPHAASATARLDKKAGADSACLHCFFLALFQIPFLAPCCQNLQIRSNLAPHLRPMAPRKVKPSSALAWFEPALDAPNVTEKNLAATRLLTAGESNERGKTELQLASDTPEPEGSTFFPFFTSSIAAGLVPPFSDFFFEVLDHFGLQALHLHPNSILLFPSSPTIARHIWA